MRRNAARAPVWDWLPVELQTRVLAMSLMRPEMMASDLGKAVVNRSARLVNKAFANALRPFALVECWKDAAQFVTGIFLIWKTRVVHGLQMSSDVYSLLHACIYHGCTAKTWPRPNQQTMSADYYEALGTVLPGLIVDAQLGEEVKMDCVRFLSTMFRYLDRFHVTRNSLPEAKQRIENGLLALASE